jgi:hypothetical protein
LAFERTNTDFRKTNFTLLQDRTDDERSSITDKDVVRGLPMDEGLPRITSGEEHGAQHNNCHDDRCRSAFRPERSPLHDVRQHARRSSCGDDRRADLNFPDDKSCAAIAADFHEVFR